MSIRVNYLLRLLLQAVAVAAAVMLPTELHVLPILPFAVERIGLVICGLWVVNMTSWMVTRTLRENRCLVATEAFEISDQGVAMMAKIGYKPAANFAASV